MFLVTRDVLYKQIVRLKRWGKPEAWKSTVMLVAETRFPPVQSKLVSLSTYRSSH